ncbi:MAG TPA: inosine/xanthosine triphosphatase [Methylomirabilota bacterium]|nr:inosine/xanthosine triphosphatase [Methylomirabilota bacterium]
MTQRIVAVGSTRKPKLSAVSEALRAIASSLEPDSRFEVVGIDVESGVRHTPLSREHSMRGAKQRAEALQRLAAERGQNWSYFAGLEGGFDVLQVEGRRRVFLESWAYISDGKDGFFGRSGAIEVPQSLAAEVLDRGVELSAAIDRYAGEQGIRDAQGAWGVLSGNIITRQEAFRVAVVSAFAPFYNRAMYRTAGAD